MRIAYTNTSQRAFTDLYVYCQSKAGIVPSIQTLAVPTEGKTGVLIARVPAAVDAQLHVGVKDDPSLQGGCRTQNGK